MGKREFSVVVYGATGFTGRLCAEYLAGSQGLSRAFQWAIAGRNESKLERVRDALKEINPECSNVELIVTDSGDPEALLDMCKRTSVVLTTVGPYLKYGMPLVDACVEAGTHYCDITGESIFVRKNADKHHEEAKKKGVRIVHCCGFDSIPSDLGTFMVAEHFRNKHKTETAQVEALFGPLKGGMSGGTLSTMFNMFEMPRRDLAKAVGNPYYCNPDPRFKGPDRRDQNGISRSHGQWTAPFVMASINTRIVRRSNAIQDFRYGQNMKYSEVMSFKSFVPALILTAGLWFFLLAAQFGFMRTILKKFLPGPGEGPSPAEQKAGHFKTTLYGTDDSGRQAVGIVGGNLDPGYGQTAVMLSEMAICLAHDKLDTSGGISTPAAAGGHALIDRLRKAGMRFEVKDA